jgi:hypothetical protein
MVTSTCAVFCRGNELCTDKTVDDLPILVQSDPFTQWLALIPTLCGRLKDAVRAYELGTNFWIGCI